MRGEPNQPRVEDGVRVTDAKVFCYVIMRVALIYAVLFKHMRPTSRLTVAQIFREVMSGRRLLALGNLDWEKVCCRWVDQRTLQWSAYIMAAVKHMQVCYLHDEPPTQKWEAVWHVDAERLLVRAAAGRRGGAQRAAARAQ